jgi:hypothetical protein
MAKPELFDCLACGYRGERTGRDHCPTCDAVYEQPGPGERCPECGCSDYEWTCPECGAWEPEFGTWESSPANRST